MPETLRFENPNGEALAARLDRPDGETPCAFALFAHCFACSKDFGAVKAISRGLTRRGIAVLRFDFTGLGESEGDFADTNFSSNVDDLVVAADHLAEHYEAPRIFSQTGPTRSTWGESWRLGPENTSIAPPLSPRRRTATW